ncbi:MAG TPA: hypothetical protein VGO76_02835 [Luteibacter sp.]|jgi:hypothetical protein|nr:hypothetical protein [Luteibacter sp.]
MTPSKTAKDAVPTVPPEEDPTVSAVGKSVLRTVLAVVLVACAVVALIAYVIYQL